MVRSVTNEKTVLTEDPPTDVYVLVAMLQDSLATMARHRVLRGKRVLDVLLSAAGLLASLPLWVLIAVAIKVEDRGAVFYRQTRVGLAGELFNVLKFRSMHQDAERVTGAVWASEHDPRVTRVGKVLRATAMDELPQLLNILKGTMSFVGPRPERPEFVARFVQVVPCYCRRFLVQPGLTGVAQIYGRYDTPPQKKLRYDLLYARKASLWLDVRLIVLSFWISARGHWETRLPQR